MGSPLSMESAGDSLSPALSPNPSATPRLSLPFSKKDVLMTKSKAPKEQAALTTVLFNTGLQINLSRLCP